MVVAFYDPHGGEPIRDGEAEEYAIQLIEAVAEDPAKEVVYHFANDLVLNFIRGFVKSGSIPHDKLIVRMPHLGDQKVDKNGRMPRHYMYDYACDSLMRLI